MTLVVVEAIVSRREFGTIFAARVADEASDHYGSKLRVRATRALTIGEPAVGETWRIEGVVASTAHGPQIEATWAIRILPTGALVRDFLARHVGGIGNDRAARLWTAFGTDLPRMLEEGDVETVAEAIAPDRPILAPRLAAACIAAWRDAGAESRLMEWLGAVGFDDVRLARRLHAILGDRAVECLAENPWRLAVLLPWKQVDGLGLKLAVEAHADKIADAPNRLIGAVDSAVKDVIATGSTMASTEDIARRVAEKIGVPPTSPIVASAVRLGQEEHAISALANGWRAPGCALMEEAVVKRLRAIQASAGQPFDSACALDQALDVHERLHGGLHPEQRSAVAALMARPFACLQGGAGVGKTFVTRAVCDVWESSGGKVLLMAVAGKAALRLSRATGRLARTLFRTVKEVEQRRDQAAGQDTQSGGEAITLAEITPDTLVVVDEASMVDLGSLHALLRNMPEGSRLLMVGDERQLPPVGFGLTFHRFVADAEITVRLTTVHRQSDASGIPSAAAAIRSRRLPILPNYGERRAGVCFLGADTAERIAEEAVRLAVDLGALDGADVMVVTPVNAGPAGTTALNVRLHDLRRERTGLAEVRGAMGERFSVGDPTLFRRNHYQKGLFNGSLGTVASVDPAAGIVVSRFDGAEHALEPIDMVDVSLGYALTCHRAQGSQAKNVIVALPPSRLLDPSWLYTAVTRAEDLVVLVGREDVVRKSLEMPWADERRLVGLVWSASI